MAFVNVVLLTRGDSVFVKGAVSGEDGSFVIDSPCNDGIIKVSSIGYTTVFRDCRGEDMGVIRLSEESWMLGEIVVRSQLPKTVLSGEGMTTTYQVACWRKLPIWSSYFHASPACRLKMEI